jgi:phosphoribosylformylglycinamidine synthase subunit PurSL
MAPWQIWISESQERMTLAVPPQHLDELIALFARRDVEATDLGAFTDDGRCVVTSRGRTVLDLELDFLLDGWPAKRLRSRPPSRRAPESTGSPTAPQHGQGGPPGQGESQAAPSAGARLEPRRRLLELLADPSRSSREDLALRFDHEVQGTSVLKPLVGPGRVDADVTAIRPLPRSWRGVAVSQGLCPEWSEADPYRMACWAVDAAVRTLVAAGARLRDIALLDNFCWCSPHEPERLWQLKEACRGCFDTAVAYGTPFISGKDSMHNDFRGYDETGAPVELSIPPTLLISSLAVVPDVRRLVTLDAKAEGDRLFLLGRSASDAGVPALDASAARRLYEAHAQAVDRGLVASSIALGAGGFAYAAARKAIASGLGLSLRLVPEPCGVKGAAPVETELLFSPDPARLLLSCAPAAEARLLEILTRAAVPTAAVGRVTRDPVLEVQNGTGQILLKVAVEELDAAYRTDWRART